MGVLSASMGRGSLLTGLRVCCRIGCRGEQRRGGAIKMTGNTSQKYRKDRAAGRLFISCSVPSASTFPCTANLPMHLRRGGASSENDLCALRPTMFCCIHARPAGGSNETAMRTRRKNYVIARGTFSKQR